MSFVKSWRVIDVQTIQNEMDALGGLTSLAVVYRPLSALTPFQNNARTHTKRQIRQIAESIRRFGFLNPILVDGENRIIAGHGRWQAAKLLGMEFIPTICIDRLSEDLIRAYILADNKLAENAGWDKEILAIELQHLLTIESLDFDVTVTGFEIAEIDAVIAEENGHPDEEPTIPEPDRDVPAVTLPGDVWKLDKHRIICGNSLHDQAFRTLMGSRRAAGVFTDPPFNVPIDGHATGNGAIRHREFAMASGEMSEAEFVSFLINAIQLLARYSTPNAVAYICSDWRHIEDFIRAAKQSHEQLANICVWVKDNGGMGSFYRSQHEFVAVFRKGKGPHRNNMQLG
jgi:ParB-like nuclease domain/DNA methylase